MIDFSRKAVSIAAFGAISVGVAAYFLGHKETNQQDFCYCLSAAKQITLGEGATATQQEKLPVTEDQPRAAELKTSVSAESVSELSEPGQSSASLSPGDKPLLVIWTRDRNCPPCERFKRDSEGSTKLVGWLEQFRVEYRDTSGTAPLFEVNGVAKNGYGGPEDLSRWLSDQHSKEKGGDR